MNLLLLQPSQFNSPTNAIASPRQSEHIKKILKLKSGDAITLGKLDGNIGQGIIENTDNDIQICNIVFDKAPPKTLPVTLLLGMPRPQMLKRILQTVSTMGVRELHLFQSSRVEKSFWQSPSATPEGIHEQLILGLEQGMATQLPKIEKHLRFRPFIEDKLDGIVAEAECFIADPNAESAPHYVDAPTKTCLAIGPEGGFIEKEVDMFKARGFTPIHLGSRILKVETAVPVLLSKLFEFQQ